MKAKIPYEKSHLKSSQVQANNCLRKHLQSTPATDNARPSFVHTALLHRFAPRHHQLAYFRHLLFAIKLSLNKLLQINIYQIDKCEADKHRFRANHHPTSSFISPSEFVSKTVYGKKRHEENKNARLLRRSWSLQKQTHVLPRFHNKTRTREEVCDRHPLFRGVRPSADTRTKHDQRDAISDDEESSRREVIKERQ